MNLKRLETIFGFVGIVSAFALVVLFLAAGWGIHLIGWSSAVAGFGLVASRLLAAYRWRRVLGTVMYNDTANSANFIYQYDGAFYSGIVSDDAGRDVRDVVPLRVNPENPSEYIEMSPTVVILGMVFMCVGPILSILLPAISFASGSP